MPIRVIYNLQPNLEAVLDYLMVTIPSLDLSPDPNEPRGLIQVEGEDENQILQHRLYYPLSNEDYVIRSTEMDKTTNPTEKTEKTKKTERTDRIEKTEKTKKTEMNETTGSAQLGTIEDVINDLTSLMPVYVSIRTTMNSDPVVLWSTNDGSSIS